MKTFLELATLRLLPATFFITFGSPYEQPQEVAAPAKPSGQIVVMELLGKTDWTDERAREKPGYMTFDWNGTMTAKRGPSHVQLRYFEGSWKNSKGTWLNISVYPNE